MAIPGSIMVIVCIYRIEALLYRPEVVCDNNKLTSFDCIQTDTVGNFLLSILNIDYSESDKLL